MEFAHVAEQKILKSFETWATSRDDVRALLLTSTRAFAQADIDRFSDFDVILVVQDIRPYFGNRKWLLDFGSVLVSYRDPIGLKQGFERCRFITQYESGLKIDFTLWPVPLMRHASQQSTLINELDVGYRVLLDKDNLTGTLPAPTRRSYIPRPPSSEQYLQVVEEFLHEATYVAKHLWRGELMPLKYSLDHMMKHEFLRVMFEWRVECDHGWSLKTGADGKGLKNKIDPEMWAAFEQTYVGADLTENWRALFDTVEIFRKVAGEVDARLGPGYPNDLHARVVEYLRKVEALDRP